MKQMIIRLMIAALAISLWVSCDQEKTIMYRQECRECDLCIKVRMNIVSWIIMARRYFVLYHGCDNGRFR